MKTPLLRILPVCIGLAMVLTACDNREIQAPSASDDTQRSGSVAFRLADTVLNVVKQTSDSVRIEAVRVGYTTQSATGSIGGNTLLTGLAPGAWTLKVATFDTLQAVSWSGEAVVQIQAGSTINAVIALKRASGSVNVQIVLDTASTTVDTVIVNWIEGNPGGYDTLPVEGAWRGDKGIYIATRYDYFVPVVVHNTMQSSLPRRLYLGGTRISTFAAVKLLPHIVFVPFPADEDVIVSDLSNDSVFKLPGNRVVAKDSSFVQYTSTSKNGKTGAYELLQLKSDGSVTRQSWQGVVDSGPAVGNSILPADSLAMIRRLLESSATRHPGFLPAITATNCPTDQPYNVRQISYADGTTASMSWNLSSYCGEFPAPWTALDQVDLILRQALTVVSVRIDSI